MNCFRAICLASLFLVSGAGFTFGQTDGSSSVSIDYVAWYYKPAQAFKRIAEYFGSHELTGRKIILRTDPEKRAGLYYVIHLDARADKLPQGSSFELAAIFPDSPKAKLFQFPLPDPIPGYRVVWIGLTGQDTPADEEAPVAWQILIKDKQGQVIATKQSFLWSDREVVEAD